MREEDPSKVIVQWWEDGHWNQTVQLQNPGFLTLFVLYLKNFFLAAHRNNLSKLSQAKSVIQLTLTTIKMQQLGLGEGTVQLVKFSVGERRSQLPCKKPGMVQTAVVPALKMEMERSLGFDNENSKLQVQWEDLAPKIR